MSIANSIAKAVLELTTDLSGFNKGWDQAQKTSDARAKSIGKSFSDLGADITRIAGGIVTAQALIGTASAGWHLLVGGIEESIAAAGEAETAHVQLVAALRAQGTAIPSVITAYQGYADALQKTTIYQDDAIDSAAALLVQIGNVMPRDMQKALEATTNLASGLGIDLTNAATMVAKAAEGNTGALKKAGVTINETKGKALDFAGVLDQVNDKFAGQAAAIAGTYDGRLKQLGNTWNNVQESIGRVITQNATVLEAFNLLNQQIISETGELNSNTTATNLVSGAVILTVKAVAELAQGLDYLQMFIVGTVTLLQTMLSYLLQAAKAVLQLAYAMSFLAGGQKAARDTLSLLITDLDKMTAANNKAADSLTQTSQTTGNALQLLLRRADDLAAQLEKTRGQTVKLKDATDTSTDAWDRHTTSQKNATAAAEATAKAQKLNAEQFGKFLVSLMKSTAGVRELEAAIPGVLRGFENLRTTDLDLLDKEMGVRALTHDVYELEQATHRAIFGFKGLSGPIAGVPLVPPSIPPLTGFKALFGKVEEFFKGGAKRIGIGFLEGIGNGLLSGGLNLLVGGVTKLFDKLFGHSEQKKVNDMRDAFQRSFGPNGVGGTFDDMARRAKLAGYNVKALLDAKTVKDYTAEMEKLNAAIAFQDGAMSELAAAEEEYHFSVSGTASELYKKLQLLKAAGYDELEILRRQKEGWQKVVGEALQFGIKLPPQLKGIIQQLIDMGGLTDNDGKLLTDITQLSFDDVGSSAASNFERMVTSVDKLVAAIKLRLGFALDEYERRLLGITDAYDNLPGGAAGQPGGGLGRNPGGGAEPPSSGLTMPSLSPMGASLIPAGASAFASRVAGGESLIQVLFEGRTVARAAVPHIPGIVRVLVGA